MKRYEYNYGKNPEGTLSTISGYATETTNFGETAFGILNKSTRDEENFTTPEVVSSSTATLFSVGNGTDHDSRKNIIELKADGTVYINGVGLYDGTNPGEATDIADEFQGIHDDITGLNEDVDRIDNTIESIHISEDNENLIYTLLVDGQERGTINIPRDQFLKNVSYNEETNNLEFTFIVRGENNEEVEKQINVNMTDLEDIYSAGDGLNLENKLFSVKVDADTQPYIEVTANGVKIIGIDEKFDTVNQNVTDLTNRVTTAENDIDNLEGRVNTTEGDIDAILSDLSDLMGDGEGSVQDQINQALEDYLSLSGGTMTGSIIFESEPVGNVGDAVLYDKQANKLIIVPTTDDMDTQYPADNYEPIGVVVIPASHDVYGTGECGVMSLKYMNYNTPDTGRLSADSQSGGLMYWGGSSDSLPYKNEIPLGNTVDGKPNSVMADTGSSALLPAGISDGEYNEQCLHDTNFYYEDTRMYAGRLVPSPYLTDGSRNPGYYQTSSPLSSNNALSDFDGIGNSLILWNDSTWDNDWKTASTIADLRYANCHPAACCCWRYHTSGTRQGDWYLPAAGELYYMVVRRIIINESLDKIKSIYNNYPIMGLMNLSPWSSTKGGSNQVYIGSVQIYSSNITNRRSCVVAFTRIKPRSNSGAIVISGKSDQDLLNAAGGTTSISDITSQIDLTPYATKLEVGSNIYTDSNYLSKETNLTDAVLQLDEEIKATNDNLDLEHANAEATYAKKTELDDYLPLSGGILSGNLYVQATDMTGAEGIALGRTGISVNTPITSSSSDEHYYNSVDISNHDIKFVNRASNKMVINEEGITIRNKTANDLLNAAGSTTSISDISTQVQAAIVDSAPETLDTLNELAAALGDDPNFATTVTNLIGTKVDNSKWETIANTNIVTSIDDFSYAEDSIQLNHKFILKNDNGSFNAESQTGKTINAATSTTAGVMSAADKAKLDGLSTVATSGSYNDLTGAPTIPTVQSGQTGTNTNYVYSSAADEGYRVLSDISCTRTGDVVKLQGRTWGMPSNSSLDLVTLPLASSSMAGLMSTTDKSKLDQITITGGDIVASGFRIYGGTADEVLTADGDSNTLKTIDGQTLLGSGDIDMSPYFKLREDNTVFGDTVFMGDMHIQSPYGGIGTTLLISADMGDAFIGCRNGNNNIVTVSSNKLSTYGLVGYPTFYMIAEQANADSSPLYQKVMFSIDRDEDGLTRLSLGNFDETKDGDNIILGSESYITSNGIKLPGKDNRDFLVGDGTTVDLNDLADDIVLRKKYDQEILGSMIFTNGLSVSAPPYSIRCIDISADLNENRKLGKIDILNEELSVDGVYENGGAISVHTQNSTNCVNIGNQFISFTGTFESENRGIYISGKTSSDLLHAAGGTTTLKTINGKSLLGSGDITTPTPTVNAASGTKTIWTGTQSAYEAVTTKDANTLYFITEG